MSRKVSQFPKTDVRYWEGAVAFHTAASRTYCVQIQHAGRRARINLRTANKAQAAFEARKLYLELCANGWEETMRRRKPDPTERKVNVSVGQYIEAAAARSLISPKTLLSYTQALRKIAGDIAGEVKRGRRDAVKLRTLTREKIEAWRIEFVRQKATDPLKEKSARVSANSLLLRARSLFGAAVIARVAETLELPEPLPFAGVKTEKVRVARYRATFDMAALLESARQELATERSELYKIFLLAACAGLRRNEIDCLPWSAFRWEEGVIRIETTHYYRPKTRESEGDILVDSELMELFRGYHARRKSDFVIESAGTPPPFDAPYGVYRCMEEMRALLAWLRAHGVVSKTALHTLRKEYGSQINARYGLAAAREMLRHANIHVTAAHYVENKHRSVLGFGHLLAPGDRTIVPLQADRTIVGS
jgi:hypothetical protein